MALIEKIRFLTDLRSLSKELAGKGSIYVEARKANEFLANARLITASLDDIPDNEITENYKRFLNKLELYIQEKRIKKMNSISILKDFISSKSNLFEGNGLTIGTLVCALVKVSVESVVEWLVSRYENHFHKNRVLDELNALDEMEIEKTIAVQSR